MGTFSLGEGLVECRRNVVVSVSSCRPRMLMGGCFGQQSFGLPISKVSWGGGWAPLIDTNEVQCICIVYGIAIESQGIIGQLEGFLGGRGARRGPVDCETALRRVMEVAAQASLFCQNQHRVTGIPMRVAENRRGHPRSFWWLWRWRSKGGFVDACVGKCFPQICQLLRAE